jgi:hypothetical protein
MARSSHSLRLPGWRWRVEELSGFWSLRFLRRRIVYSVDIQKKIIIVWAVGHRREIYGAFNEYMVKAASTIPEVE